MTSIREIMNKAIEDGMRKSTGLDDWHYHDLPKLEEGFFNRFVEIAGEENIKWITIAEYRHDGKTYKRGQMMLSPKGKENIAEWVNKLDKDP